MNAINKLSPEESIVADFVHPEQRYVIPYIGDADAATRIAILKALANDTGLRLPNTIVPEGTPLIPYGEERKRELKRGIDALPDAGPAMLAYAARLRAENPIDTRIPVNLVRMNSENGRLFGNSDPTKALPYTRSGFDHMVSFVKPTGLQYTTSNLLSLPNDIRALAFNYYAQTRYKPGSEVNTAVLRSFQGGSGRIIRAVVSEAHSLEHGDDLAIVNALASKLTALHNGAKARVTRTPGGDFSEMEIIWPMMDRQLVAGDVAYGGVRITNSETKKGSIRIEAFLLRVLCLNFTTAFSEDFNASETSLRHVGDVTKRIMQALEGALTRIEPFVLAFGDAYREGLPNNYTRADTLERVERKFGFHKSLVARAAELWDADGVRSAGDTRAGLVNALTRASQELNVEAAAEVERGAGRLILDGWDALS